MHTKYTDSVALTVGSFCRCLSIAAARTQKQKRHESKRCENQFHSLSNVKAWHAAYDDRSSPDGLSALPSLPCSVLSALSRKDALQSPQSTFFDPMGRMNPPIARQIPVIRFNSRILTFPDPQ